MKPLKAILSFVIFLVSIINVFGQADAIKISRLSGVIEFNGVPDEDTWKTVNSFGLKMWKPDFGGEPSEISDIRIGYDNEYLWVGASLYMKDPSKIFVGTKKRDEMLSNYDAFGVVLDPYNDNENGLAFFTNPEGLRTDYTIANDAANAFGALNTSWDTFWDVKTSRDAKGWYVEMRIPFSSLKFRPVDGIVTMGMIISRNISSNNESDLYPSIDPKYGMMAYLKPSQAVKIAFEGPEPSNPVYIAPYISGGFSRDNVLVDPETGYVRDDKPTYDAGLDIKYNINSNLTLDLTANTDFAQVEADDQQVNLTRYSLFFPEKRKFFQERSGLFDFSLSGFDNLFYSRSIGMSRGVPVRIYGGARLTGRVGNWDLGFLDMQTEKADQDPAYNYGVLRMRRQVINANSFAGGIFTSRLGMNGDRNFAYGLDGIFRLFGEDYLSLKWAQTYDSKIDNKMTSIDPAFVLMNWERRSQKGPAYELEYYYSGEKFNPGIGFIRRKGVQGASGRLAYGWLPGADSKIYRTSINLRSNFCSRLSDGELESASINPSYDISLKSGYTGSIGIDIQKEGVAFSYNLSDSVKVYAGDYSFVTSEFRFGTPGTKKFSVMSSGNLGQFYDGTTIGLTIMPEYNISSSLNIAAEYEFNAIRFPDRPTNNSLNIHSINMKASYMLSTKITATIMSQYVNTYDDLITNFRLRYNPREGNDFYLVLNDYRGLNTSEMIPPAPNYFNETIMLKYVHTFIL
ncbi:MAG TPA: DUF5916 domain-containing protein [Bacteroidales bacterium]|nr:DUF5916 domain-containing protein [Bacteroidales bacterium]